MKEDEFMGCATDRPWKLNTRRYCAACDGQDTWRRMKNIKAPEDKCWETCPFARDLPNLKANPDKYVMSERSEFHLCGNCAARREGVETDCWLLQKIKELHGRRYYHMMDFKRAREYAENNVRVSGWRVCVLCRGWVCRAETRI